MTRPHRILITGGDGFIGSHLAPLLEQHGHVVYTVDYHHAAEDRLGHDLTRPGVAEAHVEAFDPTVVVHLAAQVGRVFGEDDPAFTIRSNATMTTLVARAASAHGARLVYASTSEVYGDLGSELAVEQAYAKSRRLPHNLYGVSKAWGEEACALYAAPTGLQVVRPSMPYGPGLPAGRGRAAIINMLDQAARGAAMLTHDPAERSWCWIGDLCEGLRLVVEKGEVARSADDWRSGHGVYNVGNDGDAVPMRFVASLACFIVGRHQDEADRLIQLVPAPENQTAVKRLGMAKLRRLGWSPLVGLEQGMSLTWASMLPGYPVAPLPPVDPTL